MKNPEELHYYCTFDANTGEKLGGYILEFQKYRLKPSVLAITILNFTTPVTIGDMTGMKRNLYMLTVL